MQHKNLASERVRLGLSQKQLASQLGITTSKLHMYETLTTPMSAEFAYEAAAFFGCSIDYLLDRTDERLPIKQPLGITV